MKRVIIATIILGCTFSYLTKAEVAVTPKSETITEDLSFLQEYDARIKALNNYTVTFIESINHRASAPVFHASHSSDGMKIKFIHVKRKST